MIVIPSAARGLLFHAKSGFLVVLGTTMLVGAQQPPTIRLEKIDQHPAEWTSVAGVRELRDGRVLVLDVREQIVKLVDFSNGTAAMVGGKGHGPGEYVLPTGLQPLPGDSTALFDDGSIRPLLIGPSGQPAGILDIPSRGRPTIFVGVGTEVDGMGRFYRGAPLSDATGTDPIERLTRATGRIDTVGHFSRKATMCADAASAEATGRAGTTGAQRATGGVTPFVAIEQWAVSFDGRLATVCHDPYRVRITGVDGKRITGPVIPYTPVKVTETEKQAWRDERAEPVAVLSFGANGQTSAGFQKMPIKEPDAWPATLPPFTMPRGFRRTVLFAPDGMLWIRREVATGAPAVYDVVGKDARLAFRVALPPRARVVGFGRAAIYVATSDEDDIQRLQRFRLPAKAGR